jgi:hypothetical protein
MIFCGTPVKARRPRSCRLKLKILAAAAAESIQKYFQIFPSNCNSQTFLWNICLNYFDPLEFDEFLLFFGPTLDCC